MFAKRFSLVFGAAALVLPIMFPSEASAAAAGKPPRAHSDREVSVMRLTGPQPLTSTRSGNTCQYYPPNYYFGSGTTNEYKPYFDVQSDAQVSNSGTYSGGSNSADSDGYTGLALSMGVGSGGLTFPTGSKVTAATDWIYDGNLSAQSSFSTLPYLGGVSSSKASMDMYVNFVQGSGPPTETGGVHAVSKSLSNSSGYSELSGRVTDGGNVKQTLPAFSGQDYFQYIHVRTHAENRYQIGNTARANSDFRSSGRYAGAGRSVSWTYILPTGYTLATCGYP